jgi:hypothetical protein
MFTIELRFPLVSEQSSVTFGHVKTVTFGQVKK